MPLRDFREQVRGYSGLHDHLLWGWFIFSLLVATQGHWSRHLSTPTNISYDRSVEGECTREWCISKGQAGSGGAGYVCIVAWSSDQVVREALRSGRKGWAGGDIEMQVKCSVCNCQCKVCQVMMSICCEDTLLFFARAYQFGSVLNEQVNESKGVRGCQHCGLHINSLVLRMVKLINKWLWCDFHIHTNEVYPSYIYKLILKCYENIQKYNHYSSIHTTKTK